ncbi:four helix bundle protein [Rhodoplanes sp. SY1]|uniref:four helix bundle protein n=1 Tax=Rhodoplanes sp. SY1 TaxID=3166646 RepID=UPI0038B43C4C
MSGREISSYRDLRVWQDAMALAEFCYRLTKVFPREELFGLSAQIRRAAASVPANIAEGHGREHRGSFVQHLRIAQGSLKELETHLLLAVRVGVVESAAIASIMADCETVGKMLRSLIRSLQNKAG